MATAPSILQMLTSIDAKLGGGPEPSFDLTAELQKKLLDCTADPKHERVLIRYTKGSGRLSADKKYIALDMKMYLMDGRRGGWHQGVWERLFNDASELLAVPPAPAKPLDIPVGPVQHLPPLAQTKAVWDFGDGNAVFAVGPALSHLVQLGDGSGNFSVACSQIITNGTGIFAGVHGLKQSLGSTQTPPGAERVMFAPGVAVPDFTATTIDTFRIVWPNGVPPGAKNL